MLWDKMGYYIERFFSLVRIELGLINIGMGGYYDNLNKLETICEIIFSELIIMTKNPRLEYEEYKKMQNSFKIRNETIFLEPVKQGKKKL